MPIQHWRGDGENWRGKVRGWREHAKTGGVVLGEDSEKKWKNKGRGVKMEKNTRGELLRGRKEGRIQQERSKVFPFKSTTG